MIRDRKGEDLHLDFKTVGSADLDRRDDRKNLAIAVAGFANADGGLLVWGVDARPDRDGIDCAVEKQPIRPLTRFLARLNQLTADAASPVVDGVVHREIPLIGEDVGFAATLVPRSDSGPHMAKLGEDRYYKRSGSSFVRMEHFDVEDMFGRRPRAVINLTHRVVRGGEPGFPHYWNARVILGIGNAGRGVARAPYLGIQIPQEWRRYTFGIDGNERDGLGRLVSAKDSGWTEYGASADFVIHSGAQIDVVALTCPLGKPDRCVPGLSLSYRIAAIGVPVSDGRLNLHTEELVSAVPGGGET